VDGENDGATVGSTVGVSLIHFVIEKGRKGIKCKVKKCAVL